VSKLRATHEGIIDTTYIVSNEKHSYILKKYEREIDKKLKGKQPKIDAANGEFVFDIAVALLTFNTNKNNPYFALTSIKTLRVLKNLYFR
jgi:hypothetical protein